MSEQRLEDAVARPAGDLGVLVEGGELQPAEAPAAESAPVSRPGGERQPAGADDLETLLAEFDRGTSKPAPVAEPPQPEAPVPDADLDTLLADIDRQQMLEAADPTLRAENERAWASVEAARQAYQREYDLSEFDRISVEIGDSLRKEFPYLPEGYARARLVELATRDDALVRAFDNRQADPRTFAFQLSRVRTALRKEAASVPDPQLSEDKLAVIQAVRGASDPHIPEPPPNLGQMSDAELRQYTKQFGF
jgi:hypothetical protein